MEFFSNRPLFLSTPSETIKNFDILLVSRIKSFFNVSWQTSYHEPKSWAWRTYTTISFVYKLHFAFFTLRLWFNIMPSNLILNGKPSQYVLSLTSLFTRLLLFMSNWEQLCMCNPMLISTTKELQVFEFIELQVGVMYVKRAKSMVWYN